MVLALIFLSSLTWANCQVETCSVDAQNYAKMFEKLENLYPRVLFDYRWSDNRVIAAASRLRVTVTGGFARKEGLNLGGLITVACHEETSATDQYQFC